MNYNRKKLYNKLNSINIKLNSEYNKLINVNNKLIDINKKFKHIFNVKSSVKMSKDNNYITD
jgi:hypothetical protein